MKKFLTNTEKNNLIKEREKTIVESFAKIFNKIKRIDEENFPKQDTNIDELIASFKEANGITDDIIGVKKYIELAELRSEEAEMDDMEFYMNLWHGRLRAAKAKLVELTSKNQMNELDGDDYEQASRGVEYGVNPYSEKPSLFDGVAQILVARPEFHGSVRNSIYGIYIIYKSGKQQKATSVEEFNQMFGTDIPPTKNPDDVVSYLEAKHPEVSVSLDEFDVS